MNINTTLEVYKLLKDGFLLLSENPANELIIEGATLKGAIIERSAIKNEYNEIIETNLSRFEVVRQRKENLYLSSDLIIDLFTNPNLPYERENNKIKDYTYLGIVLTHYQLPSLLANFDL